MTGRQGSRALALPTAVKQHLLEPGKVHLQSHLKNVEPQRTGTDLRRKKPLFRGFFTMHIERRNAQDGLLTGVQRLVIIHQNLCHFRTGEFRRGRNALTQHLTHLGP